MKISVFNRIFGASGLGDYRGAITTETQRSQRSHREASPFRDTAVRFLLIAAFLIAPSSLYSTPVPQSAPNIGVNGSLSANKVKRGRTVQATVVMNIPSGYHVNSSRPLEKFLIATQLKVEAPREIRVGAVSYPRAVLRKFQFSKNRVSVYEGRATMRFSISIPNDADIGSKEIKVRVRYQSCNHEACFPPQNKDVSLWLNVE
ncbi:MAG TPA: protein-disulfide reductase DsbD domain-containing protein [Pyrinomonadaceae bacterium]|nr:protein-disulfide reductase DsbD domain-containing protein [Pyrinomonadaceae bacterium]